MNRRQFLTTAILGPLAPHLQKLVDVLAKPRAMGGYISASTPMSMMFTDGGNYTVRFRKDTGDLIDITEQVKGVYVFVTLAGEHKRIDWRLLTPPP